jgi:hypothetical protein
VSKVFWFFFSKKNILPSLSSHRPPELTSGQPGPSAGKNTVSSVQNSSLHPLAIRAAFNRGSLHGILNGRKGA